MLSYFKKTTLIFLCTLLISCGSTSENNVEFSYLISASADINPDIEGRPSAVLVRVYQLTNNVNFGNASYEALFESDHNALGSEYITLNEYLVDPQSRNEIELKISEHTRFIGVVVGYRSVDMVTWRTVLEVPEKSFWKDSGLEIKVEKLSVRVIKL
ncbi:MAG: type VI secretion system lipoprotein TssJ [Gammaproteobacteria bacterium]|nr:MAG: type VI secretion system lipoprotein TssJ [Gammaproteobacteria bacterium]